MENILPLLTEIFEVCVIPLLGVLTAYLVKFIRVKSNEISTNVDNELGKKYIQMLADTISTCVISTNQIYCDSLKRKGEFTLEAQKEAFNMTLNGVMSVLSDEAKVYLTAVYGDLNMYITKQIEATVKQNKIEISNKAE